MAPRTARVLYIWVQNGSITPPASPLPPAAATLPRRIPKKRFVFVNLLFFVLNSVGLAESVPQCREVLRGNASRAAPWPQT